MFEPYAAKSIVQHSWVADTLSVWLTFRFPMNQLIKPADTVWLVKIDGSVEAVTSSAWQDAFTMLLSVDSITSLPAEVKVSFNGPDSNLETTWHKNWEPWGYILSQDIGAFVEVDPVAMAYLNQSVKTTASPTFIDMFSSGKIGGDGQNVGGIAALDFGAPLCHIKGVVPRIVIDATYAGVMVFANSSAAVNSKLFGELMSTTLYYWALLNDDLSTKKTPLTLNLGNGKITVSEEFRSNGGFNANGSPGITQQIDISGGDGVNHTLTFTNGLLTDYFNDA